MEKPKTYTSPFGKAIYPHLNRVDTYKTNGDKFKEKYHVKIEFSTEDAKELIKQSDEALKVALAEEKEQSKSKKPLKTSEFLGYSKEGDKVIVHFKMKAHGRNNKTNETFSQKPALFDNELKPLDPELQIWGGSNLRVSYTPKGWYSSMLGGAGVTFRLKSVQVKDLVQGSSNSNGGGHGFSVTEGNSSENNNSTDTNEEEAVVQTNQASDF